MPQTQLCPKCGTSLPPNAPGGICPKCLMRAAMSDDPHLDADAGEDIVVDKTVITPPSTGFTPPGLDSLAPHFPQLELLELLGHGGMGAVYKARQLKLDRLVALKILKPDTAHDPNFAERFAREARTLARLSHSNIVAVHDFGEADVVLEGGAQPAQRLYYFIMEYVDGANLRQLLESDALQADDALAVVPQICEALQFAHDEGVVHRDIKPENILVDKRGRVKIADFGLARLVSSSPAEYTLTGTNQVMGTPLYMAPEQMSGSRSVDHRADIYSLGVVFYELLTGEVPMGQFDPPSKKVAIDSRLDEVVLRALASDPERRFQRASEMQVDVQRITQAGPAQRHPSLAATEDEQPAGFSTIAEREAQRVLRWFSAKPRPDRNQEHAGFPLLTMLILSIAGGLAALAPWVTLRIGPATPYHGTVVALNEGSVHTVHGWELMSGLVAAAAFVVCALLLPAASGTKRLSMPWAILFTLLAAVAIGSTVLFHFDAIRNYRPSVSLADARAASSHHQSGQGQHSPANQVHVPMYLLDQLSFEWGFVLSLGSAIGLLAFSACGIRHAAGTVGQASQPKDASDPPLTSIRFTISETREIGPQIVFHFSGLGYRLQHEEPGVWVFQRGSRIGSLTASDIRAHSTTLSVRTAPAGSGELIVNCLWSVRAMGSWITRKDISKLEAEGLELRTLIGGHVDEPG